MPAAAVLLLLGAWAAQEPPLPEGNAFVRSLIGKQRQREEALDRYAYDIEDVREELDGRGRLTYRRSRLFQVFYVKGRPVRKLVAEDGRALPRHRQVQEENRVRELSEAIRRGEVATERPGLRISAMLERYDFRAVGREAVHGRPAVVLEFQARPGDRALASDAVLRKLAGRVVVDEAEREVVRVELRSTEPIKIALGLGASVSSVDVRLEFHKVDGLVWLPLRVESRIAGKKLLFKSFQRRSVQLYSNYSRFEVESDEQMKPPSPPPP
jgi:hypothetical protein